MPCYRSYFCILIASFLVSGCRQSVPPSFSPGPEVVELTADLEEDPEELEIYRDLQQQIADVLLQQAGTPEKLYMLGTVEEEREHLKAGYELYEEYCTQCHGVNGDGMGPVAEYLNPKPRNYKRGVFKFTSTPYGNKPRKSDLVLTLKRGVTGTSMPAFDRFSPEQLSDVADYVIALTLRGELERELAGIAYDDGELPDEEGIADLIAEKLEPWHDAANQLVMPVSEMPEMTDETVLAGHQIFLKYACNKCHGKYGRGGSMGNVEVGKDVWGYEAAAADLSSGMFRGGGRPIDIYRRIYSGINGTPMPAFKEQFKNDPDAIWQLVHFIRETGERRRRGQEPLSAADLPDAEPPAEPAEAEPTADDAAEEPEPSEETEPTEKSEPAEQPEPPGEEAA